METKRGITGGQSTDEVKKPIDLSEFEDRYVGNGRTARYYFQMCFVQPALERAFKQLSAKSGN